jgi:hypothetical protein
MLALRSGSESWADEVKVKLGVMIDGRMPTIILAHNNNPMGVFMSQLLEREMLLRPSFPFRVAWLAKHMGLLEWHHPGGCFDDIPMEVVG